MENAAATQAGEHLFEIAIGNGLAGGNLGHLRHATRAVFGGNFDQGNQPIFCFGAESQGRPSVGDQVTLNPYLRAWELAPAGLC